MLVIFLSPTTIKLLDSAIHHHDNFVWEAKQGQHFHTYHEKCPILSYESSLFSFFKLLATTYETASVRQIFSNYKSNFYCNSLKYSFLLRAPPVYFFYIKS
jgi:hypothetical protein